MNRKLFVFALAATLVVPMAADADIKLSGVIQGEITSSEIGDPGDDDDRETRTYDSTGSIFNSGPNKITFDMDEKLGSGVTAYARFQGGFNTSTNSGISGREAWLGLKTSSFYVRYGKITGAYKSSIGLADPWAGTSLQTRGTGGGMTGSKYNEANCVPGGGCTTTTSSTNHRGLAHSGYVEGALEAGVKFGGFYGRIQGIVDDTSDMDGAGLLELRYTAPNFAMWLSGAYTDLDLKDTVSDVVDDVKDTVDDVVDDDKADDKDDDDDDGLGNWKIGGQFKLGPALTLGLQYEDAELGAFESNADGGKYILGSVDFSMNNFSLAAWVAGYLSDIDDNARMLDADGNPIDEDALSWAVGGKYKFSKRTMLYAGYRQTDSDNDYRDEDVFALGLRHKF